MEEIQNNQAAPEAVDTEVPLDKNVRLMSPTRMVVRRFFRSKLSILGLIMVVGLFLFSFLGPVVYTQWGEIELDESGKTEYAESTTTYTVIKRLCERGVLKNEDGTVTALVSKEAAQAQEINELVEEKFQGSLPAFIAAFTKRQDISNEELDEVQRMIDRIRNGG